MSRAYPTAGWPGSSRVRLGVALGVGVGVSLVGLGAGAGVAEAGTTLRASAAVIGLTRSGTAANRTDWTPNQETRTARLVARSQAPTDPRVRRMPCILSPLR